MKTLSILSLSACLSVIAYNAYSLTCGAQPSCSDLGYTYTGSSSECINTPMKCPFNSSYFNCIKKTDAFSKLKSDIFTSVMPDYSKKIDRSCNTSYTASSNGYLFGHLEHSGSSSDTGYEIWINGVNVRLINWGSDFGSDIFLYPVRKGASYRVNVGNKGDCGIAFIAID